MPATTSPHALIIEDQIIIALEVEQLLREIGFASFDVAATPHDAIEMAQRHRPDLITADVRIVEGTGIEAVRAITEQLGEIPYIYVTGNVDMLPDVDAETIVEKPINPRRFRRACVVAGGPLA
jgi:CheY-like chemotaxis protein